MELLLRFGLEIIEAEHADDGFKLQVVGGEEEVGEGGFDLGDGEAVEDAAAVVVE